MDSQSAPSGDDSVISYVIYDKATGTAIGLHRHYDVETDAYVEANEEEVLRSFASDSCTLERVTDHSPNNLVVFRGTLPYHQPIKGMRVSRNRLVQQPKLVMYCDQDELEGNGIDTATLTIMLQDARGRAMTNSAAEVLVTTTRGKLSARGGRVALQNGRATLTLQSVPETVQRVRVRCQLVDDSAEPVGIQVAFV